MLDEATRSAILRLRDEDGDWTAGNRLPDVSPEAQACTASWISSAAAATTSRSA